MEVAAESLVKVVHTVTAVARAAESRARDHMEDTVLDLIRRVPREVTEDTAVDQAQASLVRDLVDMVMAVEDQERCVSFLLRFLIIVVCLHMTYHMLTFSFVSHLFYFNIIYKYSLAKDPVDTAMAVDQVQGSQEKHLDTVTDRAVIRRVPRGATEDTVQARAAANQARDHLVDTVMDQEVAQANLVRDHLVDTDMAQVLIQRVPRAMVDTARDLILSQARDHLVDMVMDLAVAQVNLARVDMALESQERDMVE